MNTPQNLLYKFGPMISLINYKGWKISNFNLPGGSGNGGKLLGESLPNPFDFSSAILIGTSSKLKHTYPYGIGFLALSLNNGL